MDLALSDSDLSEMCKEMNERCNIKAIKDIIQNDLSKEDVFNNSGHCILFYENIGHNIGHWLTLIRKPNDTVYLFDSLGEPFEKYGIDKWLSKNFKCVYYNPNKFQSDYTNTCGKFSLIVICLNKFNFNYKQIEDFFKCLPDCDEYLLKIFE